MVNLNSKFHSLPAFAATSCTCWWKCKDAPSNMPKCFCDATDCSGHLWREYWLSGIRASISKWPLWNLITTHLSRFSLRFHDSDEESIWFRAHKHHEWQPGWLYIKFSNTLRKHLATDHFFLSWYVRRNIFTLQSPCDELFFWLLLITNAGRHLPKCYATEIRNIRLGV